MVKNLPAMQESRVRPLGWEDSPREQYGNPLQYSRLETPMERGVWRATAHGAAKSRTQLSDKQYYYYLQLFLQLIPFLP